MHFVNAHVPVLFAQPEHNGILDKMQLDEVQSDQQGKISTVH